jgi:hypothetical protein
VVDTLSGGWLSYEGDDDDEERPAKQQPAKRETFEERLERELASLPKYAERPAYDDSALPASVSDAFDESIKRELERLAAERQQLTAPPSVQTASPAQPSQPFRPAAAPMGFGRKIA